MGAMQLTKRLRKDLSDVQALAELSRKHKSRKLGQVQTGILVPSTNYSSIDGHAHFPETNSKIYYSHISRAHTIP
jgi:hypothetical protein